MIGIIFWILIILSVAGVWAPVPEPYVRYSRTLELVLIILLGWQVFPNSLMSIWDCNVNKMREPVEYDRSVIYRALLEIPIGPYPPEFWIAHSQAEFEMMTAYTRPEKKDENDL